MSTTEKTSITVETNINAPVEKVWKIWTEPKHITKWNSASEDWHTPRAENDLEVGKKFLSRMEAKDGSAGFDFEGVYEDVKTHELIAYTLGDDRKVRIIFTSEGNSTKVTETFDAENTNPIEMQQSGWQAILDNFKQYVESLDELETLQFETTIHAGVEKVYHTMLDEESYAQWTAIFSPGSHYKGSWDKGSKILFLGPEENGETSGMVSRIKENIPLELVSIEHLGMVQNGQEITSGPEVESWAGALENYIFSDENGTTVLKVSLDAGKEYKDYFLETWPKALEKLKAICES
ncbi:MAG: SRPBCC domain-containing protein [Anditalea sp.]